MRARNLFIGIAMRGAVALQKALPINEETYLGIEGSGYHEARAYYLYGVLDEVLKSATAMLRWHEFLKDPDKAAEQAIKEKEHGAHVVRVTEEALSDEQHLWARKLTELLCDLLLFESTNTQEFYRIFLACEHLDAYLGLQRDFQEFFGCTNLNAQESIQYFIAEVKQLSRAIDLTAVWFLKNSINLDKPLGPGRLFCSTRARFKSALLKADADQKITLGVSYETAYSTPSRSIHANIGGPPMEISRKSIEATFSHIILLCTQIILQAHKLSGIPLIGDSQFVQKMIAESNGTAALVSLSGKELDEGDIVFAYGKDLCIVTDKNKSPYGYTSYKVKHLTTPPLPEVPEDWYPARYVHLLCPQRQVREHLITIFKSQFPDAAEKIQNMPQQELLGCLENAALEMFKEGIFDRLFVKRA